MGGGVVTIRTLAVERQAILEVHDTGNGIDRDVLPHIFEPFYRADKARLTTSGETGLGLTVAQEIVRAHGGRIEAESTNRKGKYIPPILADRLWLMTCPALFQHLKTVLVDSRSHIFNRHAPVFRCHLLRNDVTQPH